MLQEIWYENPKVYKFDETKLTSYLRFSEQSCGAPAKITYIVHVQCECNVV